MAITISSDSLVSLEEYRVFRDTNYPITANQSGSFSQVLNLAAGYIKSYTNRTLLSGSLQQEIFSGNGFDYNYDIAHSSHTTMQAPILNNPVLYEYVDDAWSGSIKVTAFDSGEYYEGGGLFYFPGERRFADGEPADYFLSGVNNYRLDYEYGYTIDNIPQELKLVQMSLAKYYEMVAAHIGVDSTTGGEKTKNYSSNPPTMLNKILDRYKS